MEKPEATELDPVLREFLQVHNLQESGVFFRAGENYERGDEVHEGGPAGGPAGPSSSAPALTICDQWPGFIQKREAAALVAQPVVQEVDLSACCLSARRSYDQKAVAKTGTLLQFATKDVKREKEIAKTSVTTVFCGDGALGLRSGWRSATSPWRTRSRWRRGGVRSTSSGPLFLPWAPFIVHQNLSSTTHDHLVDIIGYAWDDYHGADDRDGEFFPNGDLFSPPLLSLLLNSSPCNRLIASTDVQCVPLASVAHGAPHHSKAWRYSIPFPFPAWLFFSP